MNENFVQFKYRAIDKHLVESLVNPSLYFAKPSALNDPFDCRLDLHRAFIKVASSAGGDRAQWLARFLDNASFFENWKSQIESLGVCSFSSTMDNALLWSHYADEHRGVCLEYQLTGSFLRRPKVQLTAGGEVTYLSEPLTDFLEKAPIELDIDTFVKGLVLVCLRAKSPAWLYEKEARLIRREPGVVNIDGDCIREVCFGLQTSQADIDLVIRLARDYCGCVRFSRMVRDESDFGFEKRPYEYR
jgi:hypothetical protein